MGAGSFPAGSGPAGFDPIAEGVPVNVLTPQALRYEGSSRDWALADDGNYRAVHWVEQAFAIGCLTRRGSNKSSPDVGNDVHAIPYLGGLDLTATIEDCIRKANPIATLLKNGDADIVRIDHQTMPGGGLKVAVYFKNLRLDKNRVNSQIVAT